MLPFVAGLAVGGLGVFALSSKKEIKEVAQKGYEKSKEIAQDIKKSAVSTAECIKSKMSEDDEKDLVEKTTTKKKTTTSSKTKKA